MGIELLSFNGIMVFLFGIFWSLVLLNFSSIEAKLLLLSAKAEHKEKALINTFKGAIRTIKAMTSRKKSR